jgi:hypothetical protein
VKRTLRLPSRAADRPDGQDAHIARRATTGGRSMLMTILIIVLILALVGGLPRWGYSRSWGYGPSGILGVIVIILIILWLLGRL